MQKNEQKFSKIVKDEFSEFFKRGGYLPYDKFSFGRLVNNELFQFVNFQQATRGEKSFMVDFACHILYKRRQSSLQKALSLKPGGGVDHFKPNNPELRWFEYNSEEQFENSIKTVKSLLEEYVFPWFDRHSTTEEIFPLYEDKKLRPPDDGWMHVDLMYMNLRLGNLQNAKAEAEYVLAKPPRFEEMKNMCVEVINGLSSQGFDVEAFLNGIVQENKRLLKLVSHVPVC